MRVMNIPIVRGQDVAQMDASSSERVALVNETFANRYFPNGDALDRHIRIELSTDKLSSPIRIVGVVGDFRHHRPPALLMPAIYEFEPFELPTQTFVLRTRLG